MSDYISRKAAIKAVQEEFACETCNGGNIGTTCTFCNVGNAIRHIKNVPAADVAEVRHGRWEWYSHSYYCGFFDADGEPVYRDGVVYYCSNPKCRRKTVIKENFCTRCGSKMGLEDEENDKQTVFQGEKVETGK